MGQGEHIGWDRWTCANAAEGGHLEVLKWARENGCPEYYSDDDDDDDYFFDDDEEGEERDSDSQLESDD